MINKRSTKKRKMKNNVFLMGIVLAFLFSCTNETEQGQTSLPYLGHHDILNGDTTYHRVPDFNYLTQDSVLLSSTAIEGKVWVAKFFFTKCPTICPPMTASMHELVKELDEYANEIVFLSFTIDPENDTPKQLRAYRKTYEIEHLNWFFLTGDETETHDLGVHGFFIHAQADEDAPGGFAHSPNFVLVDENRNIRGVYDGLEKQERERLVSDIKHLLENE